MGGSVLQLPQYCFNSPPRDGWKELIAYFFGMSRQVEATDKDLQNRSSIQEQLQVLHEIFYQRNIPFLDWVWALWPMIVP